MPHISELADLLSNPGPGSVRGYGRCPAGLVHRTGPAGPPASFQAVTGLRVIVLIAHALFKY